MRDEHGDVRAFIDYLKSITWELEDGWWVDGWLERSYANYMKKII